MHALAELKLVPKSNSTEAAELARTLGLELQAARYEKPLAEKAFTVLSADEVVVWNHHCPTHYGVGERTLKDYGFDSVPLEVMRHWKSIKDNYSFDRYEIWTTERTRKDTDPLLIGAIGQRLYLLARWGMEAPESLSVRGLAKGLHDAWLGAERADWAERVCWVHDALWLFRSAAYKQWYINRRALDWMLYNSSNRFVFAACRRILDMEIPPRRFRYYYD